MGIKCIDKIGITLPKGITGIDGTEFVIENENNNTIQAYCEATELFVNLIIINKKVDSLKCDSLNEDGSCRSLMGPRDENGNTICNIKI